MKFNKSVIDMVKINMGLVTGESVLIVSDVPTVTDWNSTHHKMKDMVERALMAREIFDILKAEFSDCRVDYLTFHPAGQHGSEPSAEVAERFIGYDVLLFVTTWSLSHTNAREAAAKRGARIASMPGVERSMFAPDGPMSVDYLKVASESDRFAEMLTNASQARVTTKLGTDLSFSIAGRTANSDTGLLHEKGVWGNLPGGEAFIAPVEGTASGTLVVPKGWFEGLEENMTFTFEKGYVVKLEGGGKLGDEYRRILDFGNETVRHRRNCAELGIGTNRNAKKPDNVLEAEKIKGTVHVAIGDSSHMGGMTESDLHEDFILPAPTLYLDGVRVEI